MLKYLESPALIQISCAKLKDCLGSKKLPIVCAHNYIARHIAYAKSFIPHVNHHTNAFEP